MPIRATLLTRHAVASIALVLSLAGILVILAVLQYRWSGQVSEAERERMQASLGSSISQFRQEFNSTLQQLGQAFQPDASVLAQRDWQRYAQACMNSLTAADAHWIVDIYLWVHGGGADAQLLRLDRGARAFAAVPWPAKLEIVRDQYDHPFPGSMRLAPDGRPAPWIMFSRIPLLVHPLAPIQPPPASPGAGGQVLGHLMIELSLDALQHELFPELTQKYFGSPDGLIYQVAVFSNREPPSIIFQSDPNLTMASMRSPDARISLLDSMRSRFGRRGFGPGSEGRIGTGEPPRPPPPPTGGDFPRPARLRGGGPGVMFGGTEGMDWELLAKHRQGSLESAISALRRRNLAISFGILLLLGTSAALIIAFAQRAQRLAQLQMSFVAGVSHELRTPLAVICAAGDNLAAGVVPDSGPQVRHYGEMIRDEGRKLTTMVEHVLQFESIRSGRRQYNLRPSRIQDIVDAALLQTHPMIEAAGFTLEKTSDGSLPLVNVDPGILAQCIQNLIQNALKYSGDSRWLACRIAAARGRTGPEVRCTIEDRGMGIEPADLPLIFDPFYRGRAAAVAQIHGTGLGLFMVREALEAMGGKVTVQSAPGKGAVFTLHLPACQAEAGSPPEAAAEAVEEPASHGVQNSTDRG